MSEITSEPEVQVSEVEMRIVKDPQYSGYSLEYFNCQSQMWEYLSGSYCVTRWGAKWKARHIRKAWPKRLVGKLYWYI